MLVWQAVDQQTQIEFLLRHMVGPTVPPGMIPEHKSRNKTWALLSLTQKSIRKNQQQNKAFQFNKFLHSVCVYLCVCLEQETNFRTGCIILLREFKSSLIYESFGFCSWNWNFPKSYLDATKIVRLHSEFYHKKKVELELLSI